MEHWSPHEQLKILRESPVSGQQLKYFSLCASCPEPVENPKLCRRVEWIRLFPSRFIYHACPAGANPPTGSR